MGHSGRYKLPHTSLQHSRRIPGLILVRPEPQPDVLTAPPVLIVEILFPEDTYSDTQTRANDYLHIGVPTIWIFDPATRTARVCSGPSWVEATRLEAAGTPIFVELSTLFAALDAAKS